MDYNARWYSPSLGRFTQPDIIVPGMYNPQNLNRYSYVNNNPIRFADPSGHSICDRTAAAVCTSTGGGTTNRFRLAGISTFNFNNLGKNVTDKILNDKYGVTTDGFTEEETRYIATAVQDVAKKLKEELSGDSTERFREVYGTSSSDPLKFIKGPCGPRNGNGGCGTPPEGAYTWGSHEIEYAASAPFYGWDDTYNRTYGQTFAMNVHSVVHELGHAFSQRFLSGSDINPYRMTGAEGNAFLQLDGYANEPLGQEGLWIANTTVGSQSETFANSFVGYIYGDFGAAGGFREEFMGTNMTGTWLPALTGQ